MSERVESITIDAAEGPLRLDRWFRRHYPALGHGRLEKLLRTGQIRVDGKRARAGDRLLPGQEIRVPPLAALAAPVPPRHIAPADQARLEALIMHRDAALIVLNKPAGLAVQGGSG